MPDNQNRYTKEDIEEGTKIINKIRTHNGAIDPRAAAYLAENFPTLSKLSRTIDGLLSRNLYAKSTRFIFELIQNADDNSYTKAAEGDHVPWASLTLTPSEFKLECNEDGFTGKNVWAVCKVTESTKSAENKSQGYIGEKGIAFKSVFPVFKKAHIQSGRFAFSFLYGPEKVTTRVALSVPHSSSFEQVCEDLRKIPDTVLLFLNRIRQLDIHIIDEAGKKTSVKYTRGRHGDDTTSITQIRTTDQHNETETKKYLLERRRAIQLPLHDTRKDIHGADIVLAFPLNESGVPVFEQQHVFAFLPLQQAGFNVGKCQSHLFFTDATSARFSSMLQIYRSLASFCTSDAEITSDVRQTINSTLEFIGVPELPPALRDHLDRQVEQPDDLAPSIEIEEPVSPDIADAFDQLSISTPVSERSPRQSFETPSTPPSAFTFTVPDDRLSSTVPLTGDASSPSPESLRDYASILDRIITIVNGDALSPSSPFSWTTFMQLFPERNTNRDIHVGVEGEVVVLEYLQKQNIPDSSIANWRGNLRTRARVHPRYSNIGPTMNLEVADFVYTDAAGALTRMLKRIGALPEGVDVAENAEYLLEVKTTTSECGAEFYMSQHQVNRMESMTFRSGVPATQVYVIARVFNIDREKIGLRFFDDPQRFRERRSDSEMRGWPREMLNFSVDKWTVKAQI